jgi:hypothetical protein
MNLTLGHARFWSPQSYPDRLSEGGRPRHQNHGSRGRQTDRAGQRVLRRGQRSSKDLLFVVSIVPNMRH